MGIMGKGPEHAVCEEDTFTIIQGGPIGEASILCHILTRTSVQVTTPFTNTAEREISRAGGISRRHQPGAAGASKRKTFLPAHHTIKQSSLPPLRQVVPGAAARTLYMHTHTDTGSSKSHGTETRSAARGSIFEIARAMLRDSNTSYITILPEKYALTLGPASTIHP